MPLLDVATLGVLLLGMPVLAIAQTPLLSRMEIQRLPAYWSSIVTIGALAVTCLLIGTRAGGLAAIGVVWTSAGHVLLWSAVLTAAGLLTIVLFKVLATALGVTDTRVVHELMPRTPPEKRVFVALSLTAGVGEEIAYRGYAIPVLAPLTGPLGALAVTSAVFGVIHTYQGSLGILRTGVMGAILAGGFLVSGSLIPCILAHALIDVLAGIVFADRLLVPNREVGVEGREPTPS